MKAAALAMVVCLAASAAACGSSDAPPASCVSGRGWNDGDSSSPLMHPGGTCLSCHASEGDPAPRFEVAGTVMQGPHDDDDCDGLPSALVRFTGADGVEVKLLTNPAGNFYRTVGEGDPIVTPYTVTVEQGGRVRPMKDAPSSGDCNTCHTRDGASDAPGRIVPP